MICSFSFSYFPRLIYSFLSFFCFSSPSPAFQFRSFSIQGFFFSKHPSVSASEVVLSIAGGGRGSNPWQTWCISPSCSFSYLGWWMNWLPTEAWEKQRVETRLSHLPRNEWLVFITDLVPKTEMSAKAKRSYILSPILACL